MSVASGLAFEYFKIGNGVTAFYVVQTLLFVAALGKESRLVEALCSDRQRSQNITWAIASVYIVVVLGCLVLENYLRYSYDSFEILLSSTIAGIGRIMVISSIAFGFSQFIILLKSD